MPPPHVSQPPQTGSILVVDDDPINRRLLSRSLEADGHAVRTAENGVEALALLSESRADVVLLDIVMPEMDGIEVLDRDQGRSEAARHRR